MLLRIRVDDDLFDRVVASAERRGVTPTEVIRDLLDSHLERSPHGADARPPQDAP